MSEEWSIHNHNIEEKLKEVQNILHDDFIASIRRLFLQFNEILKTFDDYQKMVVRESDLCKLLNNIINEVLVANKVDEDKVDENKEKLVHSLKSLQLLASEASYSKKVEFVRYVLDSSNQKEILFSGILYTSEEDIKKRYKKLASHFHPDKSVFQVRHKNLGNELFRIALEFKNSLLAELESNLKGEGYLAFHEKNANEFWKITIDYRNAAKGQWNKLKVLKEEDLRTFSSEELENFSVKNGRQAYKEYRVACKIADNAKLLKKQVRLRGYIALCLYVSNNYLEAQLFALSSVQLLLQNSHKSVTQEQDWIEAKRVFDKVRGGDATADEAPKLNTEINFGSDSDNALTLVKTDHKFSYYERKNIQRSIEDDMKAIVSELMLKADRSLIRYQANDEEILYAKRRVIRHKIVGGAFMGTGAILGGSAVVHTAIVIGSISAVGGPITIALGAVTIILGLFGGSMLFKKGSTLLDEPKIREKLNDIMVKALDAYDKGDYQGFLNELAKDYKDGTSLIRLPQLEEDYDVNIVPKDIIDTLLSHGFRSDGVAYLLNLLGEVLNTRKVKINGKTTKELGELAKEAFNGALNKKLEDNAEKLDNRIRDLRSGSFKSTFNKIKDAILLKEYSDVAKEYIDDAQEMPFKARLEEMRIIARINLAIIDILDAGREEIARAIEIIKKIEDSIKKKFQFVSTVESRVEALKDLLWVINGEEFPEESPKLSLITFSESEENEDKYQHELSDLNERLKHAFGQEKLRLYISIAIIYEKLAEKEDKTNQIKSLCYWRDAQKNYEKAREINNQDLDASLGFAKCLLKLSKYTQVIEFTKTNSFLISSSEYWRLLSIAYCKQAKYREANEYIIEALVHKSILADKQWSLLQKLGGENSIENRINRYNKDRKDIRYDLKNSNNNKIPVYNILSIDGGGIRGVLPALWLSEIEHRAHRPISHLFNMIAGTSTGGIIAAGLSVPQQLSNNNYSTSKPKFLTSDLLDLYRNQAKSLFTSDFSSMMKMSYSDKGRLSLFEEYFSSIRLKQTLTELVIPATREIIPKVTHPYLFTYHDAFRDDSMNDTLVDTLMATTAAPTFFPSYMLKDKGLFLDGGVLLNNPAESAYNEAICYGIAKEKISILSLGTGDYVPEPSDPSQYRDKLFWKQKSYKAQQGCIDHEMYTMLGNRYQRWQVYLEDPIKLDDCEKIPYLLDIGNQYIEELDASDENPINKIVESFDDKALKF